MLANQFYDVVEYFYNEKREGINIIKTKKDYDLSNSSWTYFMEFTLLLIDDIKKVNNEDYNTFNNNIYNGCLSASRFNNCEMSDTDKNNINSIEYLSDNVKILIINYYNIVMTNSFDIVNCSNNNMLMLYICKILYKLVINWKNKNYNGLLEITSHLNNNYMIPYNPNNNFTFNDYYYKIKNVLSQNVNELKQLSLLLQKYDTVVNSNNNSKNRNIEKVTSKIQRNIPDDLLDLNRYKVIGLKDLCNKYKLNTKGMKLKNEYLTVLQNYRASL